MSTTKPFWQSRTIWGGIFMAAGFALARFGVELSPVEQAAMVDLWVNLAAIATEIVGGVLVVLGRFNAKKPLTVGRGVPVLALLLLLAGCGGVTKTTLPGAKSEGIASKVGFGQDGDGNFAWQGHADGSWLTRSADGTFDVAGSIQPAVVEIPLADGRKIFIAQPGDAEIASATLAWNPETESIHLTIEGYSSSKSAVVAAIAQQIAELDSWVQAGAITEQERMRIVGVLGEAVIKALAPLAGVPGIN